MAARACAALKGFPGYVRDDEDIYHNITMAEDTRFSYVSKPATPFVPT